MPPIDQATIDAVKASQPDDAELMLLTGGGGEHQVIIRAATPDEMTEWRGAVNDEKRRAKATARLVRSVVLYPKAPEFGAMLQRKPALIEEFTPEVLKLAGCSGEVEAKKL